MTDDRAQPIAAATLIIFREESDNGPPEFLMLERSSAMTFAAGALVFPGGRVDPGDHAFAAALDATDHDEVAARIAAIRETIEEAGLPIGLDPMPDVGALAAIRGALTRGVPLAEALAPSGIGVDVALLEPFARWRPDHAGMRIYDTRFYLARLPDGAPEARVDATENVHLSWASAAAFLADAAAGRVSLIYPTRRTLERLARYPTHIAAVADARAFPIRTITPFIQDRNGTPHLCIPDDLGYPVTAEPMTAIRRG